MSIDEPSRVLFAAGMVAGEVTAADPATPTAWNQAYDLYLRLAGDPFAIIDSVNSSDELFVIGPVFAATYRILGGFHPTSRHVRADVDRIRQRRSTASAREKMHADAALLMAEGEFMDAIRAWDSISSEYPDDFVATRFVHDVCLHIGDDSMRLPAAQRACDAHPPGTRLWGLASGMLAFALEETGEYAAATSAGRDALDVDVDDLWARHALAHVYESTAAHGDAIELLTSTTSWHDQTLLNNHIWWHLGLRLLHADDVAGALDVFDTWLTSTTSFGLADSTSLLWRIDLWTGGTADTATRWRVLAERWAADRARHTCAFLDMHTAFAFAAVPDNHAADSFWEGVVAQGAALPNDSTVSFNDRTFADVVVPLVAGIRASRGGSASDAVALLDHAAGQLPRIGGSVVQRDIVAATKAALLR